ncbi:MAG: FHA domain-containing protein, partial [Planctomycetota bacterium]
MSNGREPQLAYLVIREGTKWTDVFRLVPGRTVTIGRAATNQIVVKDERCSRSHAEVFLTEGRWTLRDLGSRNGTVVGEQQIQGDYPLSPGDVIRIAQCQLVFVHDLSEAFPESKAGRSEGGAERGEQSRRIRGVSLTSEDVVAEMPGIGDVEEGVAEEAGIPTTITHRRGQTRYLKPGPV